MLLEDLVLIMILELIYLDLTQVLLIKAWTHHHHIIRLSLWVHMNTRGELKSWCYNHI